MTKHVFFYKDTTSLHSLVKNLKLGRHLADTILQFKETPFAMHNSQVCNDEV
jgi:hypothetical protein